MAFAPKRLSEHNSFFAAVVYVFLICTALCPVPERRGENFLAMVLACCRASATLRVACYSATSTCAPALGLQELCLCVEVV